MERKCECGHDEWHHKGTEGAKCVLCNELPEIFERCPHFRPVITVAEIRRLWNKAREKGKEDVLPSDDNLAEWQTVMLFEGTLEELEKEG